MNKENLQLGETQEEIKKYIGKVVIMSAKESFLARGLLTKLEGMKIDAHYIYATMKELNNLPNDMELMVLFLSDELEENIENMVFLKDKLEEREIGLIVIGEKIQYDSIVQTIKETNVTEFFRRPLEIDNLIKSICTYLDENTGDKKKKNILIVDDDITYMRTIYEWLKGRYHVGMASNGVQAISYLTKNKADLVLLDYEMPIANGPQVMAMLKNDSETDAIPVMFLTGHGDKDRVMSVLQLKPADYMLKTIDRQALLTKLDLFFAKKKMEEQMSGKNS